MRSIFDVVNAGGQRKADQAHSRGFTAREPQELNAAISRALSADGPAIVDAVAAADEIPNLPHLEWDVIGHVAMAKIKEAVLAVTGA